MELCKDKPTIPLERSLGVGDERDEGLGDGHRFKKDNDDIYNSWETEKREAKRALLKELQEHEARS